MTEISNLRRKKYKLRRIFEEECRAAYARGKKQRTGKETLFITTLQYKSLASVVLMHCTFTEDAKLPSSAHSYHVRNIHEDVSESECKMPGLRLQEIYLSLPTPGMVILKEAIAVLKRTSGHLFKCSTRS